MKPKGPLFTRNETYTVSIMELLWTFPPKRHNKIMQGVYSIYYGAVNRMPVWLSCPVCRACLLRGHLETGLETGGKKDIYMSEKRPKGDQKFTFIPTWTSYTKYNLHFHKYICLYMNCAVLVSRTIKPTQTNKQIVFRTSYSSLIRVIIRNKNSQLIPPEIHTLASFLHLIAYDTVITSSETIIGSKTFHLIEPNHKCLNGHTNTT